jgi:hypothetical protein
MTRHFRRLSEKTVKFKGATSRFSRLAITYSVWLFYWQYCRITYNNAMYKYANIYVQWHAMLVRTKVNFYWWYFAPMCQELWDPRKHQTHSPGHNPHPSWQRPSNTTCYPSRIPEDHRYPLDRHQSYLGQIQHTSCDWWLCNHDVAHTCLRSVDDLLWVPQLGLNV